MELINTVAKYVPEDAAPELIFLFVLFALFIYPLFRANAIYDFIDRFNSRESTKLKELINDNNISGEAKESLRLKLDLLAYQRVTGIKTKNIYLQKRIIKYCKLAEGRLRYSDFNRAFLFLQIDEHGSLFVRQPNNLEKGFRLFWTILSIITVVPLCFLLAILVYVSMPIRIWFTVLLLIVVLFAMLLSFTFQASLIPTAAKIRKEVEENYFIIQHRNRRKKLKQEKIVEMEKYKQLRPYGLCEGEFVVPEDFDEPLPRDILNLFEGK